MERFIWGVRYSPKNFVEDSCAVIAEGHIAAKIVRHYLGLPVYERTVQWVNRRAASCGVFCCMKAVSRLVCYYKKKSMQRNSKPKKKSGKLLLPPKTTKHYKPSTAAGVEVVFRRGITGTDGILLDKKPQIAFVGRSNVGKSSTINAILGAVVARTSGTPGKTQEINFFEVGGKGYFVDLPGYGYARMTDAAQDKIRKHIAWYLVSGEAKPKLLVLILDARVGVTEHDRELISLARSEGHPLLILANKIDKLSGNERPKVMAALVDEFPDADIVQFSAAKKENVTLVRKILFGKIGLAA
jgi:GTP-binding protein